MAKLTGLLDKHGEEIKEGDFVSLAANMTADDSLGLLPNGWTFDESDVYEVYFDQRCNGGGNWSLKITDLEFDPTIKNPTFQDRYNLKLMNHALSLLHDESVEIIHKS